MGDPRRKRETVHMAPTLWVAVVLVLVVGGEATVGDPNKFALEGSKDTSLLEVIHREVGDVEGVYSNFLRAAAPAAPPATEFLSNPAKGGAVPESDKLKVVPTTAAQHAVATKPVVKTARAQTATGIPEQRATPAVPAVAKAAKVVASKAAATKAAAAKAAVVKAAKVAEKKKISQKLDLAKHFNQLVKEVDSLLETGMQKLKRDRNIFRKAVADGKKKQHRLRRKMGRARRHAKGDHTKIEAIETHMALAKKAGARAFLKFVESFRHGAGTQFWETYKDAKRKRYELVKTYHKIRRHVNHACKKMYSNGATLHKTYMTKLKGYWKAKYACKEKIPKGTTLVAMKHAAKLGMKKARSALQHFKKMQHRARRHAKHLKEGLKHAISKLHFVFMKARGMYRHIAKEFVPTLGTQVLAKKSVSHQPLKKLQAKQKKKKKNNNKRAIKVVQKRKALKAPKAVAVVQTAEKTRAPKSPVEKSAAVKSAEIKAVKIVKRAILQQQREQAASLVQNKNAVEVPVKVSSPPTPVTRKIQIAAAPVAPAVAPAAAPTGPTHVTAGSAAQVAPQTSSVQMMMEEVDENPFESNGMQLMQNFGQEAQNEIIQGLISRRSAVFGKRNNDN